jgi:hypothetical protein
MDVSALPPFPDVDDDPPVKPERGDDRAERVVLLASGCLSAYLALLVCGLFILLSLIQDVDTVLESETFWSVALVLAARWRYRMISRRAA